MSVGCAGLAGSPSEDAPRAIHHAELEVRCTEIDPDDGGAGHHGNIEEWARRRAVAAAGGPTIARNVEADVTRILSAMESGDDQAADELLPVVYQELRRLAAARLAREAPGQTLQPTALVHEAYLRLLGPEHRDAPQFAGRAHFFGAAAEAMRRILVERARRRARIKHGGGRRRFELEDSDLATEPESDELLALNEALDRFAEEEPQKADLVKLRYFGGLTVEQAGELLGVSRATADRWWSFARAWLYDAVHTEDGA